jgi:hypothetical protein
VETLTVRLTPGSLARAFRALNVATGGRDFDGAGRAVAGRLNRRAPDRECRELYDLADALAAFDVYAPGLGYDETAAQIAAHIQAHPEGVIMTTTKPLLTCEWCGEGPDPELGPVVCFTDGTLHMGCRQSLKAGALATHLAKGPRTMTTTTQAPTVVVVDAIGPLTLDRDPQGALFTLETAYRYAADLNASRKPQYRTWQVLALIPAGPQYLVEEFTSDCYAGGGERVSRRWQVGACSPRAAFTAAQQLAATAGQGEFYFAAGELAEIDPGTRWAASDGSSVCYEVRLLPGLTPPKSDPVAVTDPGPAIGATVRFTESVNNDDQVYQVVEVLSVPGRPVWDSVIVNAAPGADDGGHLDYEMSRDDALRLGMTIVGEPS